MEIFQLWKTTWLIAGWMGQGTQQLPQPIESNILSYHIICYLIIMYNMNLKQPCNEVDLCGEEVALLSSHPFSLADTWQKILYFIFFYFWSSWYLAENCILYILYFWSSWFMAENFILYMFFFQSCWYLGENFILYIFYIQSRWYLGEIFIINIFQFQSPWYLAENFIYKFFTFGLADTWRRKSILYYFYF